MNKKKLIFTLFYFLLGGVLTANANITIYVNSSSSSYYMYAWDSDNNALTDSWPGTQFSSMNTTTVDGVTYYYMTFDVDELSVIFDTGSTSSGQNNQQTSNITGITEDTYFNYCGGTTYTTVSSSNTTSFTIYVNSSSSDYYLYAWYDSTYFTGTWPGVQFSSMGTTTVNGTTYYYYTFYGFSSVDLIFDTGNDGSQTGTITVTEDTYFTYSGGTTYETVDISSTSSSGTTYYLVANAGAKCKFTPDRTRGGGSLNYSYQNLHLQDFIIQATGNNFLSDGYLQFHIEDGSGNTYYLTGSNSSLENLSSTYSIPTNESNAFNGPISGDTYFDGSYDGSAAALYWVPLSSSQTTATDFKIKAGVGKSYTFLWQPNNSGLYLIVNGEEFGDASSYYTDGTRTSEANYYLIGNFSSASADDDIDPSDSDNRRMLTPYYYKDGDEYGGTMEDCDSIVYEIEVARPSAGWSELYLDLVNESDFNLITTWVENTSAWEKVIRPEATWSSSGAAYALDATALTGGLMRNENASYQSLNPVVSDDIDSYVFTMNASTSTYSIRLVSAASNTTTDDDSTGNDDDDEDDEEEETEETSSYLYIFGTAVGSSEGNSTTSDNWEGANAFKLTYSSDGGYYYYAGSDDDGNTIEATIPMVADGVFAFVTDMDFSKGYYTEDGNRPPTLIDSNGESTETTAYSANTGGGFYETQYVNMLGTNHTADATAYDSESIRTITWGLPSSDYYIRFYVGATIGEYAKNLYTVRRSYTLLRPDADAVTVDNTYYTTFKVFCDYNAVVVPSDVDVLYVPEITSALTENTDNSSDYTTYELTLSDYSFTDNSARVLPANTPVILAMTTERTSDEGSSTLETETITMDYYSNTVIGWSDISSSDTIASAMTPSIPYELAPGKTDDDGESYNFFFGYRKLSDSDNKPTIGFYLPISGGYSAINGAYLNIKSEYISSSSDDESSAKEAALVFYSDLTETDETDGSETTGISNALAADDADADGAYYTLQGIRIAKPTVKGIYIHNGKKTVVR